MKVASGRKPRLELVASFQNYVEMAATESARDRVCNLSSQSRSNGIWAYTSTQRGEVYILQSDVGLVSELGAPRSIRFDALCQHRRRRAVVKTVRRQHGRHGVHGAEELCRVMDTKQRRRSG